MAKDTDTVHSLLQIRVAVAFLGESIQCGWWKTGFLGETGLSYLNLVFPRTSGSAAVTAASAAACRTHDDRIGRGRVTHLFRLPHELEADLFERLCTATRQSLIEILSPDSARSLLHEKAGTAEETSKAGPIRIGESTDITKATTISRLAAVYRNGFRAEQPVFPYFTERHEAHE